MEIRNVIVLSTQDIPECFMDAFDKTLELSAEEGGVGYTYLLPVEGGYLLRISEAIHEFMLWGEEEAYPEAYNNELIFENEISFLDLLTELGQKYDYVLFDRDCQDTWDSVKITHEESLAYVKGLYDTLVKDDKLHPMQKATMVGAIYLVLNTIKQKDPIQFLMGQTKLIEEELNETYSKDKDGDRGDHI